LLKSAKFAEWLTGTQKTLFCPGIPGAGKTIIASIVVEHLWETFPEKTFSNHKTGVAFLYCSYGRRKEQRAVNLLSALLKQLVQGQSLIPTPVKALYDDHVKRKTRPSFDEVSESLQSTIKSYSQVFVVIDALDECTDDACKELLSEIRHLQTQSNTKVMATSRFIATIMQKFKDDINLEIRANDEDVERYLDGQMLHLRSFVMQSRTLPQLIKTNITKAADGM
jgi:Cdc6-like AAA superfamily ATPase